MAIAVIALAIICIGSVSASDELIDANLTVDENSQTISELNGGNDIDDVAMEDGNVDVKKEDELSSSDEDVLSAETTLEIKNTQESYQSTDSITLYMGSYTWGSESDSISVFLNNNNVATTTFGQIHSTNGYSLALTNAIIGINTIYCQGSSMMGTYTSDTVTFTVSDGSSSGGETTDDGNAIALKITDVYDKYDGQNSQSHSPYTDDFAFIATSASNSRYSTVVTFKIEGASSSAKLKFGSTETSISGDTASLEFTTGNVGENTIYVIDGDKKSNEVTVKVVSGANKIASLTLDPDWGIEGKNITIAATAMSSGSSSADGYTQRPISGYVTFYSSSTFNDANKIGTISTDGGSITVPFVDIDAECDYIKLYYTFAGEYNNKGFITGNTKYAYLLVLDTNPIALTGNGQTGNIVPDSNNKVKLHVTPTYYMNDGTSSFIDVYVDNTKAGSFTATSTTAVNDFELDFTGFASGDYDVYVNYTGYNFEDASGNVYYHAGNESNHLTVHIEGASDEKILKIEINEVDYPNDVIANVTASEIGTYTITIGSKTIPVEITESDNGIKTVSLGKFNAGDDYEAEIVSDNDATLTNSTAFTVNKATLTLDIAVAGNNTLKGEGTKTITATSTVSDANGIVQYFEGTTQIGENSTLGAAFDLSALSVGTHIITVKYIDDNYNCEDQTVIFTVKGDLTITLTRNGEGLVKPGDTVYFTVTYSESVSDNLELWYNGFKLGDESGASSTSITFDETDIGENNISIKFLGNDDYEACESNVVKVKVVEPVATTVSLTFNTTEVRINGKILVTAHVYDANSNEIKTGDVKVYKTSNFYYADPIATITAGESFEFTVDSNSFSTYQNPYRLYSQYAGQTTDDNIYAASSNTTGTIYYHVSANNIELTSSEYNIYAGQSVDLTVTVNGNGIIKLLVNGVENSTLAKGTNTFTLNEAGDYEFQATYSMTTNDYYASCASEKVTVHVVEATAPVVEITLDKTSVSKDGTITITPTVTGGSEEMGIVEFFDKNNIKLGDIDLKFNTNFTFDVTGDAGTVHSVYARYTDVNTAIPQANSSKVEYRIKGVLTIEIAINGESTVVKPGDTVYFSLTYSESVSDNLELWYNGFKLGDESGASSTSITFDETDIGENNISIKFLGNDDYEACESNVVKVKVVKPIETVITLELNTNELTSNTNITVTAKVVEKETGKEVTVGRVEIRDDHSNYIPIINVGETAELSYTSQSSYNNPYFLNANYYGTTTDDVIYQSSQTSSGTPYYFIIANSLQLSVNDANEITVEEGMSFDVLPTLNAGDGTITLIINGKENITLAKNTKTSLTLPVGNYTLFAEYARGNDYYASCNSNEVIVHVAEKTIENIIRVSVDNVVLPSQAVIKVNATIDGTYTIDVNGTLVNITVNGGEGEKAISLAEGDYYANVTGQDGATLTNAVFSVAPEPKIGQLMIRDAQYPQNSTITLSGEGNVTIYIEYYLVKPVSDATTERITFNVGGNTKIVEELVNGSYTGAFSAVINQTGEFTVNASYYAYKMLNGEYSFESDNILTYSINVTAPGKRNVTLDVTVDYESLEYVEAEWGETFDIITTASENVEGVIIYIDGDRELGRAGIGEIFELNTSTLGLGEHNITAKLEGNDTYNQVNRTFTIDVAKMIIWYTLTIDNVTYPDHAVGKFYTESVDGKYTITINGTDYTVDFEWYDEDGTVSFNINKLPVGTYTVSSIRYEDMEHYEIGVSEIEGINALPTFEVKQGEATLNDTVLNIANGTAPTFTIDLPNATGNLTVKIGDKNYTSELKDGKATVEITDLPAGDYNATVTYTGDDNYKTTSLPAKFTVAEKPAPDANSTFNVDVPQGSTNPVFSINIPNATGNLTVKIGDKTYTKELVNGSATITVNDLTPGNYNAIVTYSGDKNHAGVSKNTTFTIPTPKLTAKNLSVVYSANANYRVLVTAEGKAVVGEKVTIKFNGKTYTRTTDKNGYVTLKLATKVKAKKYTITTEYKGVKISNKLTVKHLMKPKNLKAKKSKKVLKIKVKTNKVNGKYLKGKKLKLKLKGKTLKAKINKKGVATFKVKKNILKKLKVGKKYKYKVSYGKDSVTKKITVKR